MLSNLSYLFCNILLSDCALELCVCVIVITHELLQCRLIAVQLRNFMKRVGHVKPKTDVT